MTPVRRWALLVAVVVAALAACDPYVQGNGVFHQEDRSGGLAPFVGIDVQDGVRLIATETSGAAAQTVVVSGDANVVQWIRTEVREDTVGGAPIAVLHVFVDTEGFVSANPLWAVVGTNGIRYLRARDGSRAEVSSAAVPAFVLDVAGGSDATLAGAGGETLHATVDGAFVHASSYPVVGAEVALVGGSRLELSAAVAAGTADGESRIDNVGGVCDVQGTTHLACCAAPGCP